MKMRAGSAPPVPVVLVRLKLRLLRNRTRQRGGVFAMVVGLIAIAGFGSIGFGWAVGAGHAHDPRVTRAFVVLGATALVIGWAVLPLISFGTDETLDPARLQLLPLESRPLMSGLLFASLIGYAPTAVFVTLAGVLTGYAAGGATVVIVLALVLLALLCAATARTLATALAASITSRRGRDMLIFASAAGVLGVQLIRFVHFSDVDAALLERISNIARWLPPGALGQAIIDARASLWARSALDFVPALIALPLLLVAWSRALQRSLTVVSGGATKPVDPDAPAQHSALFPRGVPFLKHNAWGAVAAKELRYMARDPRRKVALVQLIAFGIGFPIWIAVTARSLPPGAVLFASLAGSLALIGAMNQFGFDGGALWLDIVAGNKIRDELIGKNVAVVVQVIPIVLLGSTALAEASNGWVYIPAALVIAVSGLGAGLAVANYMSVRYPIRMPDSANPFGGAAGGQGCVAGLMRLVGMLAQGVLLAPVVAATSLCVALWPPALVIVAPACAVYGYALWRAGITIAERWAWWRQPEMLLAIDPRRGV